MLRNITDQMISITHFRQHLKDVLDHLTSPKVLMSRNNPKAVIIPYEQYVRMEALLEEQLDKEMLSEINDRLHDPDESYMNTDTFFQALKDEK